MNIYLAASYSRWKEMLALRDKIQESGHSVTSRWITGSHEGGYASNNQDAVFAFEDIEDLSRAEVCFWFSGDQASVSRSRGGRHVEFGYALAHNIPLIVVGRKENVFHALLGVMHEPDIDVALTAATTFPRRSPQSTGIAGDCLRELNRATSKHGPMHGPHEGYAVILEELDELWEEVKKRHPEKPKLREEAVQIAAMAMRFVLDVCDNENAAQSVAFAGQRP